MASSASTSLKEYLKRYESNAIEDESKKKRKKKKPKVDANGVVVVDEDPVWQKPIKLNDEEDDDSPDEKPQVDEDIDVKRMKRLEQVRAIRPYHRISEDGSGWVPVSEFPKPSTSTDPSADISPPRRGRARNDTPSPEPNLRPSVSRGDSAGFSPPRQGSGRYDSPSPDHEQNPFDADREKVDLSPPRPRRRHDGDRWPNNEQRKPLVISEDVDLSPPRQHKRRHDSHSSTHRKMPSESGRGAADLSPPRKMQNHKRSPQPEPGKKVTHSTYQQLGTSSSDLPRGKVADSKNFNTLDSEDISPRRLGHRSLNPNGSRDLASVDLSPPRKSRKGVERSGSRDFSQGQSRLRPSEKDASRSSIAADLSPPRKSKERLKTGLVTGKDIKEEIAKTKKDDWLRFKGMDPLISGQGAEPVYRDKKKGERISKDEYLKSRKKEEKPKEIKLEWGKGLAQKRDAEEKLIELELEKDKPFARSRDDPDLDNILKERVRWGDPMAHLVKRKQTDPILPDLGKSEKMIESGFIIPQEIPNHSWIKRGLDAAPNRYGIRPGRHWDGVDRSNGYEKEFFKRTNEKQATEKEAYLWSVSDM
ncbi:hypothetical protein Dimus_000104 [Dionaea muscipula]